MNDTLTRHEVRSIQRLLIELNERLELNDRVNRKEAMKIVGIENPDTFSVYLSQGKYRVVSKNKAGQQFFSRKELLGL